MCVSRPVAICALHTGTDIHTHTHTHSQMCVSMSVCAGMCVCVYARACAHVYSSHQRHTLETSTLRRWWLQSSQAALVPLTWP